jgi:tetratricopeptide (TPR) repeat protein
MVTLYYRTMRSKARLMKGITTCLIVLFLTGIPVEARRSGSKTVEMALHPARAPEPVHKYRLVPSSDELTDADAAPLYDKAIQSLPPDPLVQKRMREWRGMPVDQLPRQEVLSALQKFDLALKLVEQAARCRQCKWPEMVPGPVTDAHMQELRKYRDLAFALDVQARLQIDQGQYDDAIGTLQTSLGMARHLGEGPTLVQGMTGISAAALSLRRVEEMVQRRDAPNLYWALQDVPQPPVDLTKTMASEITNLKNYNLLVRRQLEKILQPAHDRIRLQMGALCRQIAMLQCIEAMRLYAGTHNGTFPNELSDVTEVPIPLDPIDRKPFVYYRTGSKVALEADAPKGAEARFALRYLLNLEKQ